MSEAQFPSIRIACSGLDDRDLFVVRSLLRIIDGRRNIGWRFNGHAGEETARAADILIAHVSTIPASGKHPMLSGTTTKVVRVFPQGVQLDSTGPSLRCPLRAAELLTVLDQLESEWPFQTESHDVSPAPVPAAVSPVPPVVQHTADPGGRLPAATMQPLTQLPVNPPVSTPVERRTEGTIAGAIERPKEQLTEPVERPNARRALPPIALTSLASGSPMDGTTVVARGSQALLQPATIGALIGALRASRGPSAAGNASAAGEERPRNVDVFGPRGWIARLRSGHPKAHVSSRFMLDRSEPIPGSVFQWKLVLSGVPPLEAGDTLIEMDIDLFAWQFARCFCFDLAGLGVPMKSTLFLKRWPDFGVLPELSSRPGIMLATALLTREARSLDDVRSESGASETDLACLLGASWVCGWLRCERIMAQTTASGKIAGKKSENKTSGGRFSAVVRSLRKVLGLPSRGM